MARPSDESLFVAFQQHRDVESLSALFQRRADELLRIAVFLAPRPTDAEDLVQATFLSAIARAETYRPDHRVMSWLCGILTNHARMLRRAERRQKPTAAHEEGNRDPVSAALHSELRQALSRSITALGEPYRSVLDLHLNNGLNSSEISQRLDRPAATVRKQMARAIQQLRTALPLGLATALVVRMSPAQIATQAAEAAQFVDAGEPELANPATTARTSPWAPHSWPLLARITAALVLVTTAVICWNLRNDPSPGKVDAQRAATNAESSAAILVASSEVPSQAANQPAVTQASTSNRTAVAGRKLSLRAEYPDGTPHAGIEVVCMRDDGLALTTQLLAGDVHRTTTDASGTATITGLPPGRYQLAVDGSLPKTSVHLIDQDLEHTMVLPAPHRYSGTVTDADGRPVAAATVYVSETSGRGDLPHELASTDATGFYQGTCLLSHGHIFARHAQHAQSVARRLQTGNSLHLELEPATEAITVTARDARGKLLADCLVGVVPKSQHTNYYVPHLGLTDASGCCTLPGPGPRPATVIAQQFTAQPGGLAHGRVDLGNGETNITVTLGNATTVRGILRGPEGTAVGNRQVTLSVAASRTNEPISPMLALRARTDDAGRFVFANAPRARCQLRIYNGPSKCLGPTMSQFVLAGLDIDTRDGPLAQVELTIPRRPNILGSLRATDGTALADYHIIAVPANGSAGHRMFRRRTARTDANGRFELESVAHGEAYQLGFYPPERWWPNPLSWPTAFARATADAACVVTIDTQAAVLGTLTCQALLPNGKPARRASFELRHLAYQSPLTCTANATGSGHFENLPNGSYWMVVRAPGLGSHTIPVEITGDQPQHALGPVQLQRPARTVIRLAQQGNGRTAGLRVVGRQSLGDKFVSATSQANGVAALPPLPPGEVQLLVHGPGIAPRNITRVLAPGRQWLDLDVEPANAVTLRFPFALADNPFILNGPLLVSILDDDLLPVLVDYVGATSVRGRFDLSTGLLPGTYHVFARSLWNARASGTITVPADGKPAAAEFRLRN